MIEIIASFCMLGEPLRCRDVTLTYIADAADRLSPYQCMLNGQVELAKWTEAHPNWQLRRWSCGEAGRFAKL